MGRKKRWDRWKQNLDGNKWKVRSTGGKGRVRKKARLREGRNQRRKKQWA